MVSRREGRPVITNHVRGADVRDEGDGDLLRARRQHDLSKSVMGRSLRILEAISRAGRPLSLAVLADVTHLPKSTVFRMANQLVDLGMLERRQDTFALGLRIFEWGAQAEKQRDLRRIAVPHLADLHSRLGQTVHLGVLDGSDVVYVEKIESRMALKCPTRVGGRRPAHATALGKAMLAFTPGALDALVRGGLDHHTRHTIVAPGNLHRQLVDVRRDFVSIEVEESFVGVACVASPILGADGIAVGAISVSTSAVNFDARRFAPLARATAAKIARELDETARAREQFGQ